MLLSYTMRLVCLALLGFGLAQAAAEFVFWIASPWLLKLLRDRGARRQEQALFWGQVLTHGLALLPTLAFLVPKYVAGEANQMTERVGILSLVAAVCIAARYLYAVGHGCMLWRRAVLLKNTAERRESVSIAGVSVTSLSGPCPPLAVIGLRSPRILIAQALLDSPRLQREALSVALDHERAHIRHRDNWKLFVLACLPQLGLHTASLPGCLELWRRYNDWAADDDAVQGSARRALLLAESLVACARHIPIERKEALVTGLVSCEAELEARIDRLLYFDRRLDNRTGTKIRLLLAGITVMFAAAIALAVILAPWLHEAAEVALHLG